MRDLDQTAEPYLKISNLWKMFGDFVALRDISLDIGEREFVCFLGPSGCGKTTLLRAIAGLDIQTRGSVVQAGKDISALPPSARDFGIVFQSYALFPNLTIRKNVAFGLENMGLSREDIRKRVDELLALVGLSDQGDKYPAQLSGGQQQRIALARALAMSPGLLLLDEPLSALDAKVRVHLRHEVKDLQRKLGVTTVMVTHDQEEALAMADRIVVMRQGVIEQVGTPTEIYREPGSLFVADFIGEMNQLAATAEKDGFLRVGDLRIESRGHDFPPGEQVVAAIRPDDVIPHEAGHTPETDAETILLVQLREIEFLGSFWRCTLSHEALGDQVLTGDFSVNAVRRLSLAEGEEMAIELPAERLMVFRPEEGVSGND